MDRKVFDRSRYLSRKMINRKRALQLPRFRQEHAAVSSTSAVSSSTDGPPSTSPTASLPPIPSLGDFGPVIMEHDSTCPLPALADDLRTWKIESGVSHAQMTSLLKVLKEHHPNLPRSSKTLMQTPKTASRIENVIGGKLLYLGIDRVFELTERQANNSNSEDGPLRVLVHVDGVQISKSGTKKEFWTVLMKVHGDKDVLLVQIFHGQKKPPLEVYERFVNDMIGLQARFAIEIVCHCDFPARAHWFGHTGHTAYCACPYCEVRGVRDSSGVMTFRSVACGIAFPEEKEISKRIAQWVRNVSQRGNGGEKRMRGAATASDN